jgi:hypothetical protein
MFGRDEKAELRRAGEMKPCGGPAIMAELLMQRLKREEGLVGYGVFQDPKLGRVFEIRWRPMSVIPAIDDLVMVKGKVLPVRIRIAGSPKLLRLADIKTER